MTVRSALRKILLRFGLAGIFAICLLSAASNKVWAQACWCGDPGFVCCSYIFGSSCEPITTPAARAMCPETPKPQIQPTPRFNARTLSKVKPLKCPAGFGKVSETIYGGTQCAPKAQNCPPGFVATGRRLFDAIECRPAVLNPPPAPTRGNDNAVVQPPPTVPNQRRANDQVVQRPPTQAGWKDNLPYLDDRDFANQELERLIIDTIKLDAHEGTSLPIYLTGAIALVGGAANASAATALWGTAAGVAVGGAVAVGTVGVMAGAYAIHDYWPVIKSRLW